MRDGIVRVDEIKFLKLCNFNHLARKCGSVEGELE